MGPLQGRPLFRGEGTLGPRAQARHARPALLLPPCHDRALPRRRLRAPVVPTRTCDQSALLVPLGARRPGGARRNLVSTGWSAQSSMLSVVLEAVASGKDGLVWLGGEVREARRFRGRQVGQICND